ncbi:MAG: hypothetical protein ACXVY5_07240, partial [Gaiellales bacterium]
SDSSGVSEMRISNSSTTSNGLLSKGTTMGYQSPISWDLADAGTGGSTVQGTHTVYVQWRDSVGNWSAPKASSIVLDTTAPRITAAPSVTFARAATGLTLLPVAVSWGGADTGGSGIARYTLQLRTDAGVFKTLRLARPALRGSIRMLAPGHRYTFQVWATDRAGNVSTKVAGASFLLSLIQESSPAISWSSGWTTTSTTACMGGRCRRTVSLGAAATFRLTGRSVALVAGRGPVRGSVNMYADGAAAGFASEYAAGVLPHRVVYVKGFRTSAAHTLRLVVPRSGPLIEVDAFAVIR